MTFYFFTQKSCMFRRAQLKSAIFIYELHDGINFNTHQV